MPTNLRPATDDVLAEYGPPGGSDATDAGPPPAGWYADPVGPYRRWWDGTRWTPSIEGAAERWHPLRGAALLTVVLVGAACAVIVFQLLAFRAEFRAFAADLRATGADRLTAEDTWLAAMERLDAVTVLAAVAQLVAGVAFLAWFHRAHRDTEELRGARFPGWTVWGWLVPFVSLYRPKQMVNDVWMGGDPALDREEQPRRIALVVHAWWLAWLLYGLLSALARILGVVGPVGDAAERTAFAATVCALAAGVLLVVWVLRATERLERRQSERATLPG